MAPDRNDKRIAKRATEHVTGYYDEQKRTVRVSDIRKDVPENLIRLCEYSLVLSAEGEDLAGMHADEVLQFNRERLNISEAALKF